MIFFKKDGEKVEPMTDHELSHLAPGRVDYDKLYILLRLGEKYFHQGTVWIFVPQGTQPFCWYGRRDKTEDRGPVEWE